MSVPHVSDSNRPSGRVAVQGVYLLLLVALVAATSVGWLYHFVGKFFDLVILSPMLAALLTGAAIAAAVKPAHCRNARFLMALGAVAGLLTIGFRLVYDSFDFYQDTLPAAISREYNVPDAEARASVEKLQKSKGPWGCFRAFMLTMAEAGVTIKSSHSHDHEAGTPISGAGYWGLLALEALVAMGIAAGLAAGGLDRPYCERCEQWYAVGPLATGPGEFGDQVADAVRGRKWSDLLALNTPGLIAPPKGMTIVQAILKRCEKCDNGFISVEAISRDKRDKITKKKLMSERLSAGEVSTLLSLQRTGV